MSYKVETTERFDKDARHLAKKYRRIGDDLADLVDLLENNPTAGEGLGRSLYKIRVASSDMQRGKRGGFRAIYFYKPQQKAVHLLTVYAKAKQETIRMAEIQEILDEYDLDC